MFALCSNRTYGVYMTNSEAQRRTLKLLVETGYLVAGSTVLGGHVLVVNAGTLRALARRGLATLQISPDGGMAARPTDAGRQAVQS